ncbi:MAG: MrpF/PhaF family protein [Candidatus Nitrotoga sp.]|nr:MrpF/PhaF family protein [Candidatus Nitrotoga sp.]MDO9447787.1 MrpF/PhaF family protein [Candidatus Nitrotoga sp.]
MNGLPLLLAVFLLANLLIALLSILRGPTAADRLLAALLFGTTGVAILLLLAHAGRNPALVDVALIFALLAAITGTAFAQRAWRQEERETEHECR